jgi:hypothetical protein
MNKNKLLVLINKPIIKPEYKLDNKLENKSENKPENIQSNDEILNYYINLKNFNLKIYKIFNNDKNLLLDNFINKKEIVYSLKTFYSIYPKFDYQMYTGSINTNLGEIDTIIKWFNEGCNYDFLDNQNIIKNKSILIYLHMTQYDETDGGTVVQYYLAKLLDEMGQQVRLFTIRQIENPLFNNFYDNDLNLDNTVVVYCEGINGNPMKAKNVVRWMLSELGKNVPISYLNNWGKNELVYYFNSESKISENKDKIGTIYKYLTTLYLNPNIKNFNKNKSNYCHTLRKCHYHKNIKYIHPSNSFQIPYKIKQNEFINLFNKYKYFISYDPLTFLINIATLCGCVTIVYPINGVDKISWLKRTAIIEYFDSIKKYELYGVAYGNSPNEIKFAISTVHLATNQWNDILNYYKKTHIKNFIKDINNFDNMQNIIANNF